MPHFYFLKISEAEKTKSVKKNLPMGSASMLHKPSRAPVAVEKANLIDFAGELIIVCLTYVGLKGLSVYFASKHCKKP